jgi:hypothetical protein
MKQWISDYYNQGLYSLDDMAVFVQANWITAVDYKEITGEVY